jgi:tRNA G18 (ribose-2'-O)-methylase SpoU
MEDTNHLMDYLKQQGFQIVCIEQTSESVMLYNFEPLPNQKYAFVFGNEVFGVTESVVEKCDFSLEIPQFGTKHSLNVSVSVGIICWHYVNKLFQS